MMCCDRGDGRGAGRVQCQQDLLWAMWRRGESIRESERTLGETLLGSGGICDSRVGCLRFRGDVGPSFDLD